MEEIKKTHKKSEKIANDYKKAFFDKIREFWEYLYENKSYRSVLAIVLTVYIFSTYSLEILSRYDDVVMPYISKIKPNICLSVLFSLILLVPVVDIITKIKNKYKFNRLIIFVLLIIAVVLLWIRLAYSNNYQYYNYLWRIKYFDVLWGLCILYIIVAKYTRIASFTHNRKNKLTDEISILSDMPLVSVDSDDIYYKNEVEKFIDIITKLDTEVKWSIAVVGQWGSGKTSFLNIVRSRLDQNKYEIITFNPRDSRSCDNIQEDFFNALANAMSKYDGRCNNVIADYMSSLQLIDNRNIISKIANFHHIWNKNDMKEKLQKSINAMTKKIVVMIDDFDRLSKNEIFEVLKLIDGNAQFNNMLLLTAFDKEQVEKILGNEYQSDDASFTDKFFNYEYSIPIRSDSYISDYLCEMLVKYLKEDDNKDLIEKVINSNFSTIKSYMPTIRDVKRFVNQVCVDYKFVKGDVYIDEFVLVSLIKYKHYDEYKNLYHKKYLAYPNVIFEPYNSKICLRDEKDETFSKIFNELKSKDIISMLFGKLEDGNNTITFRHINDIHSFDNYFFCTSNSALKMSDMKKLLEEKNIIKTRSNIDEWVTNENKICDFIDYVSILDKDSISESDFYVYYACVITYLAVKKPESRAYWKFIELITTSKFAKYSDRFELDSLKLMREVCNDITNNEYDSELLLLRKLYGDIKLENLKSDDLFIDMFDIWSPIKESFRNILSDKNVSSVKKQKWLLSCIDHMQPGTRKAVLDEECCKWFKEFLYANPKEYLDQFLRLGGVSSDPSWNSITCDPFAYQIFGDWNEAYKFLKYCENSKVDGIEKIMDFWELFKTNNHRPIEFENQGDVNKKIKNGFEQEIMQLNKVKKIKNWLDKIPKDVENENRSKIIAELNSRNNELIGIPLNVEYKTTVANELSEIKTKYESFSRK